METYKNSRYTEDLAQELAKAKKLQMSMLPQSIPQINAFQIAAYSSTAIAVGGDFYDFIPIGKSKMGVAFGDAVGHGIPAALLMTMALTDFRAIAPRHKFPGDVLNDINNSLNQIMKTRSFVMAMYLILDSASRLLTCAVAGMKPLLIKSRSKECFLMEFPGYRLPLGAFRISDYQSYSIELQQGDSIVLFTDGVTEYTNYNGEYYGFDRLTKALSEVYDDSPQQILDNVLSNLKQFCGGKTQEDDITIMVIQALESQTAIYFDEERDIDENHPVTTLFVNTSEITSSQKLQNCFAQLASIIMDYEGRIRGFHKDGLEALFGFPVLHENDAERAILASIDIHNRMRDYGFQVSIGINTALGNSREIQSRAYIENNEQYMNIDFARELAENAELGQTWVGRDTYHLTQSKFEFDVMSELYIGISRPMPYRFVKAKRGSEKGNTKFRADMLERQREFAILRDLAYKWLQGQGQVISIVAEAGIGKTRLASEFIESLDSDIKNLKDDSAENPIVLEGRCISMGKTISYLPFINILRNYLGLSDGDDPITVARKVTEMVTKLLPQDADEILPLLGNLLKISYKNDLDQKLRYHMPEQIRYQTLIQLRNIFRAITSKQPLLIVLEDIHWMDDLSFDLLLFLIDEIADNPLMLLCLYRPEKEHRVEKFGDQARRRCPDAYTEILLNRLSNTGSQELLSSLLKRELLPKAVKDIILKSSEGNPLFIEEMTLSLIDKELIYYDGEHWQSKSEITRIDIPETIQSIVMARANHLRPRSRYILQYASVIGRTFKYGILENLIDDESDIKSFIRDFIERELIYEEHTVPELEYTFKHAITQEVIYQSISEKQRKKFHHNVADAIEHSYKENLISYYEELSYHYSKSGDSDKSLEYLIKSGEKAKENFANESAISYFQEALDIIERVGADQDNLKLKALCGLGEVYLGVGDSTEAENSFKKAITLARQMEFGSKELIRLYNWLSDALFWQGKYDEVIGYGKIGLDELGNDKECLESALMNSILALGNINKGNNKEWVEYNERNMAFIKNLPYSAELRSPYILITIVCAYHYRNFEMALEWAKDLEKQAREHNDLRGLAGALMQQCDFHKITGNLKESALLYQKAIDTFIKIGDKKHESWCQAGLSEALFGLGNIQQSEEHAHKFLKIAETLDNPGDIGWGHRLLGNIMMCKFCFEEAKLHYQKNFEERQGLGNSSLIAKAFLRLGRAYLESGNYDQALESLREAVNQAIDTQQIDLMFDSLGYIEEIYTIIKSGNSFIDFCTPLKERFANLQLYLEPSRISKEFSHPSFEDNFSILEINESAWNWIDEFGDCEYRRDRSGWVDIFAANGRDFYGAILDLPRINLSAPRLMRDIGNEFAMEVCISSVSSERPQIGGLLVWKDNSNFLYIRKGVFGEYDVRFEGCLDGKYQPIGRGLLPIVAYDESSCKSKSDLFTYLRIERAKEYFSAYCSLDGSNWLTCGKTMVSFDDPVQVGIYAIGMIDRTVYCGDFRDGTATRFRKFRLFSKY